MRTCVRACVRAYVCLAGIRAFEHSSLIRHETFAKLAKHAQSSQFLIALKSEIMRAEASYV